MLSKKICPYCFSSIALPAMQVILNRETSRYKVLEKCLNFPKTFYNLFHKKLLKKPGNQHREKLWHSLKPERKKIGH